MSTSSEQISKYNANSGGKTDANIANDAVHLGGIPAEDFATKKYVQEYHESKEELLKQYIDEQDQNKLKEAKAYADNIVNNQDFSSFAKLTDVQTLNENLSNKISECQTNCATNLNNKITEVVNDVNDNFNDVNSAINQLNSNQNNLFQSVSDGKAKIAEAITDKGVETSATASYDTMATNISNIQTSGETEIDSNFVNTSDGTATASDILLGKTAYAKGEKIYGTLIAQAATGSPTYGTDTSGATAVASDIAYGKTAYARGQLLTGTATNSVITGSVEEIYAADTDNYSYNHGSIRLIQESDSEDTVTTRDYFAFSKNNKFCVSMALLNDNTDLTNFVIDSFLVTENGLALQATVSATGESVVYEKYRYTKEELGLRDGEQILSIQLGCKGFCGDSTTCALLICCYETVDDVTKVYLHFYTYNLDKGVIGKVYDTQQVVYNFEIDATNIYNATTCNFGKILFANTDPYTFFCLSYYNDNVYCTKFSLLTTLSSNGSVSLNLEQGSNIRAYTKYFSKDFKPTITSDDRYIICNNTNGSSISSNGAIISLGENLNLQSTLSFPHNFWSSAGIIYPEQAKFIECLASSQGDGFNFYIYDFSIQNGSITLSSSYTTVYGNYDESQSKKFGGHMFLTEDKSKLIALAGVDISKWSGGTQPGIAVFDFAEILGSENGTSILPIHTEDFSYIPTSGTDEWFMQGNEDSTAINIMFRKNLITMRTNLTKDILGIKYKNQFFRSSKAKLLSATTSDVATGKTFIGYTGEPQIGTMEVTTE